MRKQKRAKEKLREREQEKENKKRVSEKEFEKEIKGKVSEKESKKKGMIENIVRFITQEKEIKRKIEKE